jgi:pyruvate dehydrogenase E2 component (dihydrolipoamide acetyltransferase)
MATEFILPTLGEGIKEGTLVKILVKTGETVEENQSVLELETDKAVLEVPSTVSGVVQSIAAKEGSKIKVGDPIFTVEGDGSSNGAAPAAEAAPAQAESTPVATGDASESAQTMNGAEPAVASSAPVQTEIATPPAQQIQPQKTQQQGPTSVDRDGRTPIPASPSVRRFAREIGVDIYGVEGTSSHGRISEGDVKKHARSAMTSGGRVLSGGGAVASGPLPDFSKFGAFEAEPLSNVRRATANQMSRAWQAPHVTQFDMADITGIEALRKKYAKEAEKQGGKLTVTAILVKVIVAALKKFPQFNASLDLANDQIIYKKYFNVGVAVDTERGLLVPVIKNADQKGVFEIAAELGAIAERARNKKTSLEEMSGGCFTITNLGGIGGTSFTPIVNVPEVAILGVARGSFEPVWNKEKSTFEPRMMLPLSLSYDHRVIDGADGARFLRFIAEALEEPFLLSM